MGRYIIRRILWVVLLLFVVSAVTFLIFYTLPSADPAVLRAGKSPNPALIAQIRHSLGLDQPVYVQYGRYMRDIVLHFDFGFSFQDSQPVRKEIFARLPATISLTVGAVVVWLLIGLPVGVISAIRRRSAADRLTMTGALLAISAPVYWLGLVALYLFARDIGIVHIFPGAGSYVPFSENPGKWFGSLILPWLLVGARLSGLLPPGFR